MIALICAVGAESRCAAVFLADAKRQAINNLRFQKGSYAGSPALLVQTGMGPEAAITSVRRIAAGFPLTRLVSFGFAGGLDAGLAVGDLVIYSRLAMPGSVALMTDEKCCTQAFALAAGAGLPVRVSAGVTVDHVVSRPSEKAALAAAYRAEAVDMESYCLAQVAAEWRIPFLTIRAISDAAADRLPPLERWSVPGGWRAAAHDLITRPSEAAALYRLAMNIRKAQGALSEFFRVGQEGSALWT